MGAGWIHRIGGGTLGRGRLGMGPQKWLKYKLEKKKQNHILENTRGMRSGAARGIEITQSIWIERR